MRAIITALLLASCGVEPMATIEILGWVPENGAVIGTDIDVSTSVVKSSAHSLHFIDTTPASNARLVSRDFFPVTPSRSYVGECEVQADSTTGGNNVSMRIEWYKPDRTASSTATSTIRSAVVASTGTWETSRAVVTAPSDAGWAKIRLSKTNNAFNAYFDSADFFLAVPRWNVYRAAALTVSDSTSTVVPWDTTTELVDVTGPSSGVITIDVDGMYLVTSTAGMLSVPGGQDSSMVTKIQTDPGGAGSWGTIVNALVTRYTSGAAQIIASASTLVELFAGDKVRVSVLQVSGASRSFYGGTNVSLFHGVRVE